MAPPAPLAVTLGDPAGVGPELTIRAFLDRKRLSLPNFIAIGSRATIAAHATMLGLDCPIMEFQTPEDAALAAVDGAMPLLVCGEDANVTPGTLTPPGAKAAIAAIETAVTLARTGAVRGIVTQPINKANMKRAGFTHPGHTEFLAALSASDGALPPMPVMMLAHDDFRVVPVTIHIPVSAVPKALTTDLIVNTGLIVADALQRDFAVAQPRLALSGLNPHAGESGTMGRDEIETISPAIEHLRQRGIQASGPFPADTLFHDAARRTYDAVLAMYHDQALIPIKTIAFDDAVNITLGLPFVRTSPDHGTALDIAGKGVARLNSFVAALHMADRMARTRHG